MFDYDRKRNKFRLKRNLLDLLQVARSDHGGRVRGLRT